MEYTRTYQIVSEGAKRYATLNGYDKVSVRYNLGNVVEIVAKKVNKKWVDVL